MTTDQPAESRFWLDLVAKEIVSKHPSEEIVVESGHSPSGRYHVGFLREVITASALTAAIKQAGGRAKHIDFVDDFDVLRKVPADVPASFEKYIGKPLYIAPDPFDCHKSYADHYLNELAVTLDQLGVCPDQKRSHVEYQSGVFTEMIELCLGNIEKIRRVIETTSGRKLEADWSPVQILSDNESLRDWKFAGWDKKTQTVQYSIDGGGTGEISYVAGRVKLNWRLDWPARWALLGVAAEPFGRDHASSGGSFDTGAVLMKEIFKKPAPYPIPYEFVLQVGETKKMSKSAGGVMSPADALGLMPPEVLKYFIIRSKPSKTLYFDSGLGLFNLIDEFSKVQETVRAGEPAEFKEAHQFAVNDIEKPVISRVPFNHLVSLYQAAGGEVDQVKSMLVRTGYDDVVKDQTDVLERELDYVKNWLAKYAPEEVKFEVQKKLPKVDLSQKQISFLSVLADKLEQTKKVDGKVVHDLIYEAKGDLPPTEAFSALYQVLLGQGFGPKAGWFLASLDRDFLLARLRLQK